MVAGTGGHPCAGQDLSFLPNHARGSVRTVFADIVGVRVWRPVASRSQRSVRSVPCAGQPNMRSVDSLTDTIVPFRRW